MRQHVLNGIKLLISLGLIVWLFQRIDVGEVVAMLRTARPLLVVMATLMYLGAILSNALKWGVLLRAQKVYVPWRVLVEYTFVGVFFNNFLPANVGGDVMRGYGLSKYIRRRADAAVSVVVDRLIGLMALTSMAIVSALVAFVQHAANNQDLLAITGVAIVSTVGLGGGFALMLSRRLRARVELVVQRTPVLRPFAPLYGRLSEAVGAYRHRADVLVLAFVIALGTWVLSNLTQWFLAESLGGGMPLLYIFLFNPLIGLVLLIPISIGGLGVNQNIFPFFYGLVGVPETLAVSVSFLLQFIIYLTSLPGGVLWWRERHVQHDVAAEPIP